MSETMATCTNRGTVVGVDGSSGARHALAWAVAKTDRLGPVSPVLTYRVEPLGDGLGTPDLYYRVAALIEEEAAGRLASAVAGRSDLGERARAVEGLAGPALVEAAASSSLLVVGTRGRGAVTSTLLGSVSSYCVKHAEVPVAVIPESGEIKATIDEIVVGIDGSANSIAALRWAVDHVDTAGRVTAVACWRPPPSLDIERSMAELESRAERNLDEALNEVDAGLVCRTRATAGHGPTIEGLTEFGDPRRVLADFAADADLLVVGSRGHRGVPYLLLGSVATALAHHPTAPTVIVPSSTEPGRPGRCRQARDRDQQTTPGRHH